MRLAVGCQLLAKKRRCIDCYLLPLQLARVLQPGTRLFLCNFFHSFPNFIRSSNLYFGTFINQQTCIEYTCILNAFFIKNCHLFAVILPNLIWLNLFTLPAAKASAHLISALSNIGFVVSYCVDLSSHSASSHG